MNVDGLAYGCAQQRNRFLALAALLPLAVVLVTTPLRHMGPLSTLLMCCAVSAGQALAYSIDPEAVRRLPPSEA
ncbi:hypothetical protein ACS5PN_05415 [Roseateles sp. NT4]|uniref:hypothetical protein n=1 Tax=Roseateles sp. NT4 TaxID=3453715 RepID=UPI003EE9CFBB